MPTARLLVLSLGLGLLLAACAAHDLRQVSPAGKWAARLLTIEDGRTTRDQVIADWGEPSSRFEDGRVFSYRLDRRFAVVRPRDRAPLGEAPPSPWGLATYDLVLVFGASGVLEQHRLLGIR